jgi:hypothetical protein
MITRYIALRPKSSALAFRASSPLLLGIPVISSTQNQEYEEICCRAGQLPASRLRSKRTCNKSEDPLEHIQTHCTNHQYHIIIDETLHSH